VDPSPGGLTSLIAGSATPGRNALVVIGAHPDDETIGAGRLVSQWRRTLGPVTAALASDGEACIDHLRPRPDGLATLRRGEWLAALNRLGAGAGPTLELPDGRLERHEETIAAALHDLLDGIVVVAALAAPTVIDPHPDHRAVGRAAARVARERGLVVLEYPVWLTFWGDPEDLSPRRLVRVHTDTQAETDRDGALACFTSQLDPLAEDLEPIVPPAMLAHHPEQRLVLDGRASR
jgi:LmbE family N-acetylglucosaminyl deacetylase